MARSLIIVLALLTIVSGQNPATARDQFTSGSTAYTVGMYGSAARHWMQLASRGHGPAQYNVGRLIYYGRGFRRDRIEAYKWFLLAQRNGIRRSTRAIEIIRDRMTRREVAEAHIRARDWSRQNSS